MEDFIQLRNLSTKSWLHLSALLVGAMFSGLSFSQTEVEPEKKKDDSIVELPSLEDPDGDGYIAPKVYSAAEKKKACNSYNNKYLSYYDKVYLVEACKLREIQNHDVILEINIQKKKIIPVDHDIVAKIDAGLPIVESTGKRKQDRPCSALEKKYITYTYTDVYLVDRCKRRPFPDWASFIEHRKQNKRLKDSVTALTWREFAAIKLGQPMKSIVEEEFAKLLTGEAQVDVIPVDEACSGINNRDVSYMDKIYRIEKCRKREYDPETYLRSKNGNTNLKELSSEQWLSLPDGKPMPSGRKESQPVPFKAD